MRQVEDEIYRDTNGKTLDGFDVLRDHVDAMYAGTWRNLNWPWKVLTERARSLYPGTITMLCAETGATKSLLVLSAAHWWHTHGLSVEMMALEGGKTFNLHRLMAILAQSWDVLDDKWVRENQAQTERIYCDLQPQIDSFAKKLSGHTMGKVRYPEVLEWIKSKCEQGAQIMIVDPITAVATGDSRHIEDLNFITEASQIVQEYKARLILVTHPRGKVMKNPSESDMGGGLAFSRHTDTVLWLFSSERRVNIKQAVGLERVTCNRMIRVLKCRHGPGKGDRIAYHLGKTIAFAEQGLIESEAKTED